MNELPLMTGVKEVFSETPAQQTRGRHLTIVAWACALFLLAIFPVLLFQYPGLQDYPNHLARAFILRHLNDPILREYYAANLVPVPNLGWDIFSIVASRLIPLSYTGKLFIILSCLTLVVGCFVLNRTIVGRWTIAPIFVLPFVFNTGFNKGFLSFNLGIGISLWAAAWWVSLDESRWRLRLVGATLFSTLLYIVHLYAWACYAIFVFGWTLTQAGRNIRNDASPAGPIIRMARDGLQAVPALLLVAISFIQLRTEDVPAEPALKNFEAPFSRLSDLDRLIDLGSPFINDTLLVIICVAFFFAVFSGHFRYKGGATLSIVLCIILFFTMPSQIEETNYVSWRVIFAGLLFILASLDTTPKLDRQLFPIFAIVIALVTGWISALHTRQWSLSQQAHAELSRLLAPVRDGSAIFMTQSGQTERELGTSSAGLYHVGAFAVIEKRALIQSLFTFVGQQPLRYRSSELQNAPDRTNTFLEALLTTSQRRNFDFPKHIRRFDYVVVSGTGIAAYSSILPLESMRLVAETDRFQLYEIAGQSPGAKFSSVVTAIPRTDQLQNSSHGL